MCIRDSCSTCNMCVERYDHHCPWINNCIGQKNHGVFMAFILALAAAIGAIFGFTLNSLLAWKDEERIILATHLRYQILPTSVHTNKLVFIISSFAVLALLLFCSLIPTTLMSVQCINFVTNKTTNERYSRKKAPIRARSSASAYTERSDSTGSSLLSAIPAFRPEDIIN